jgi:hypothetical protein
LRERALSRSFEVLERTRCLGALSRVEDARSGKYSDKIGHGGLSRAA